MGRDDVQGFLRFLGDVRVLREESPGLTGRRQQCGAPAPPLSVVLTTWLPTFSQAWILILLSAKPGGILPEAFLARVAIALHLHGASKSGLWFQLSTRFCETPKVCGTGVAFQWGRVLLSCASLGHRARHLPQASPGVCLQPPHSGRWTPLCSLKKNNPSIHKPPRKAQVFPEVSFPIAPITTHIPSSTLCAVVTSLWGGEFRPAL